MTKAKQGLPLLPISTCILTDPFTTTKKNYHGRDKIIIALCSEQQYDDRREVIIYICLIFLLPGMGATLAGGYIGNLYMRAQNPVKREMSNAEFPIIGQ